ncbi:anti-sigma factor [Paenibacillus spongiae]|uniref:Zf-HC2 domain-containing protein n=1 Tax=Paenibacillus spongiae TaxID=2909671 RepID=A0ABY5SH47_9BACL|nr:zf-HC2 domain-containing protein [Paenibacillus spongiae]UVI32052.1 zf-HC2 domain-containing protein [Paenibacillus spongiae]
MNCQEGMEYMQRQLDGDLDERESEALISHTRHCQQCAAMFERLQLLSAGLENLPKVTPPYSIVDAILPRLPELPAVEAAHAAAAGEKARQQAKPIVPVKRWKDRFSLRAFGGVIAAGVVVGLFLVTYQPDGAEKTANSLNSAADSAEIAATDAGGEPAMQKQSSNNGSEQKGNNEVETMSSEELGAEESDGAQQSRSRSLADPDSSSERDGSDKIKSGTYYVPENQDAKKESEPNEGKGKGNSPNYSHEITNQNGEDSSAGSPDDKGIADINQIDEAEDANHKGILGTKRPVEENLSPNGNYKAVISQNVLSVYQAADNGLLFRSESDSGELGAIEWAADSKTLTYEAQSKDGSVQKFVVDPEAGTSHVINP